MFENYKPHTSNVEKNTKSDNVDITITNDTLNNYKQIFNSIEKTGKNYAKLLPVLLSLGGCATIERNSSVENFEMATDYDSIPTDVAKELEQNIGFTREVAELCHLTFNPETVKGNVLKLSQVHGATSRWATLREYETNATPEEKKFIDGTIDIMDANQQAIQEIIVKMNQSDPSSKLTIMPEGYTSNALPILEMYRDYILDFKNNIATTNIEDLPSLWSEFNQTHAEGMTKPDYETSEIIESILARITSEYNTQNISNNAIQILFTELSTHPARMKSADRAWQIGGAMQTYFDGLTDIHAVETAATQVGVINNARQNTSVDAYYAFQQRRDQTIMENINSKTENDPNFNGGVLVMGAQHSYPSYITCLPKLPAESNLHYHDTFQSLGILGK